MGHDVDSYRKSHLQRNQGGKHVCSVQREARKTMFLEQCEGDVVKKAMFLFSFNKAFHMPSVHPSMERYLLVGITTGSTEIV